MLHYNIFNSSKSIEFYTDFYLIYYIGSLELISNFKIICLCTAASASNLCHN